MNKTAVIHARIEPKTKKAAEGVSKKLGMSPTEAIRLFYRQICLRGLPLITGTSWCSIQTMTPLHPEYVTDVKGQKKSVLLPIKEWDSIREALEELDDIRTYDEAKQGSSDPIPFPGD